MQVGPYEILGTLGAGGAGTVYRARSPGGDIVALKLLRSTATVEALGRFDRERRLLETLGAEAGFVPLLDAGKTERSPYIVMRYIEGGTLRDRLHDGRLSIETTIGLARSLARSLARAHERGIVHRDLKPENILFTTRGRGDTGWGEALIADLGLAKHFEATAPGASQSVSVSREGAMVGTAGYMAPEQIDSSRPITPSADVFSLGAIVFECLTGESPFEAPTVLELLARVQSGDHTPVQRLRPEAPRWLAAAVERALDRDPEKRHADAAVLARALEGGTATSRRAGILVALALAAVSVGGAAVHALARKDAPPPPPSPPSTPAPPAMPPDAPAWFRALAPGARPALPLPAGIALGAKAGEYVNRKDGSVLVFVPAVTFVMGDEDGEREERPAHPVELSAFFVGKYEVTNAQFADFVRETGYVTSAEQKGSIVVVQNAADFKRVKGSWRDPFDTGGEASANHPVVQTSWEDARAYARWAGLRLPTEAQWECAALWDPKEKRKRRYSWGDATPGPGCSLVANLRDASFRRTFTMLDWIQGYEDGYDRTAPVGSFPDGASPCGALDMSGNAWEWVDDGYDPRAYEDFSRKKDPYHRPETHEKRVSRGGSWGDLPKLLRGTLRMPQPPWDRCDTQGFRVGWWLSDEP